MTPEKLPAQHPTYLQHFIVKNFNQAKRVTGIRGVKRAVAVSTARQPDNGRIVDVLDGEPERHLGGEPQRPVTGGIHSYVQDLCILVVQQSGARHQAIPIHCKAPS